MPANAGYDAESDKEAPVAFANAGYDVESDKEAPVTFVNAGAGNNESFAS